MCFFFDNLNVSDLYLCVFIDISILGILLFLYERWCFLFFFIGDCANNSDAFFPDGAIDSDSGVYFISFCFHLNGKLILFLRNFIFNLLLAFIL